MHMQEVWEVEVRPSPSAAGSPDEQCCGGAWRFWGRVSRCPAGRSWLGGGGEAGVEYWPRVDCCRHDATVAACRLGLFLDGSGVLIMLASRWWQWWCDSGASSYGGSFPVWLVASRSYRRQGSFVPWLCHVAWRVLSGVFTCRACFSNLPYDL